jgi:hypothetical protein
LGGNAPSRHECNAIRSITELVCGKIWNGKNHLIVELRQLTDISIDTSLCSFRLGILSLYLDGTNDNRLLSLLTDDEIESNIPFRKID